MQTTSDIRSTFLDFFAERDHEVVASSPLVPRNDPTLLFTNAGMVQFKNVFTGLEKRGRPRAATSQKCVRAGGKHNDLENVGYTARHHTFFEMLGNFSFGDYFKDVAIDHAWTLITREYGLPADRLLVTVYAEDDQAADLWKRIAGLPEERIIRIPTSDNFWAMGDTGPCGPCSEIFYDHGDAIPGGPPGSPGEDGDRFIEIWNLVFMQFEQVAPDERISLPRPSIDTGMGLERIAAVLQGRHDNYDIDLMRALIEASADASNSDPDGPHAVSHRVIADHLRASAFLIADGVLPSREGRGYVLRRIMRRAMRHAHMIGCTDPLLWKLTPALARQMGDAFPELHRAHSLITETLRLEESRFKDTLGRGLRHLEAATDRLGEGEALPGEVAFRLYDTYGFPLDLTQDILRGQGRTVELDGFEAAMRRQREAARAAWAGTGDAAVDEHWFDLRETLGATEFLGYSTERAEAEVQALVVDGSKQSAASANGTPVDVQVVVNQTPFYGEAGGQVGDTGALRSADGALVAVRDVQRRVGDLFVHIGQLTEGTLRVGDAVELAVHSPRRSRLRANHSATHLLHEALRRQLGAHVTQKGSLVAPDRLRFDFSHPQAVARAALASIEAEVNARIRGNSDVSTTLMEPDAAIDAGAMALFGEKYGEEVRVVSMGGLDEAGLDEAGLDEAGVDEAGADEGGADEDGPGDGGAHEGGKAAWSIELCGGTHVTRTGDIGLFRILSESAVASGVRRIEAVTGVAALAHVISRESLLEQAAAPLRATPEQLPERVAALVEERRQLERELRAVRQQLASGSGADSASSSVEGVRLVTRSLESVPARELRGMADTLRGEIGSGVVAIVTTDGSKASLVVAVSEDLSGRLDAVTLAKAGSRALGGRGGGGRPDLAQAGGPDAAAAPAALAAIRQAVSEAART